MGTIKTTNIEPIADNGTVTLGSSGDTFTVPSGVTIANSGTATGFGETNTPAFMVRLASNFTLTDQATVKVNFDTEDFDTDSAFASNKFTVPSGEGGKYFISAQLGVSASGSVVKRSDIYIYVNGSKVASGTGFDSSNTQYDVFVNVALSFDLSAGDYVEIYNYNDVSSGTPVARASDKQSYFTGFKIT